MISFTIPFEGISSGTGRGVAQHNQRWKLPFVGIHLLLAYGGIEMHHLPAANN